MAAVWFVSVQFALKTANGGTEAAVMDTAYPVQNLAVMHIRLSSRLSGRMRG